MRRIVSASPVLVSAYATTSVVREHRIDCLDHCLRKLALDQRELVVDYRDSHRSRRRASQTVSALCTCRLLPSVCDLS
jgi:hypothetical protein